MSFSSKSEIKFSFLFVEATVVPLPHLILSSIRFLPLLKDGHAVVDKLLDILTTDTCPLDVQKEIIFSLPHTVSDAQHERIGVALKVNCR